MVESNPEVLYLNLIINCFVKATTLENDMAAFLQKGGKEFCDIHLVLEDRVIPAHKSILAARCSYFQAMFRSFMPPDNKVNVRFNSPLPTQFVAKMIYILHFRSKSVISHHRKKHLPLYSDIFIVGRLKCHLKIHCIFFRLLHFMVSC